MGIVDSILYLEIGLISSRRNKKTRLLSKVTIYIIIGKEII
jgi:hypothetical protein